MGHINGGRTLFLPCCMTRRPDSLIRPGLLQCTYYKWIWGAAKERSNVVCMGLKDQNTVNQRQCTS